MELRGSDPMKTVLRGGLVLAAFSAFLVSAIGCMGSVAGTFCGTEVQDPYEVAGCVEQENGEPAIGVRVVAIASGPLTKVSGSGGLEASGSDTAITDREGFFLFKSLPHGNYNLIYEDVSRDSSGKLRAALRSNVNTLIEPQFVQKVKLQRSNFLFVVVKDKTADQLLGDVECHLEGTPYYATTSPNGVAVFEVPQGSYNILCYKVNYTPVQFQTEFYKDVTKKDGNKTVDIQLSQGEDVKIPSPINLIVTQDPATSNVNLSWGKPVSTQALKYRVKRNVTEMPAQSKSFDVGYDLFYFDAVFGGEPDTVTAKTLVYSVACVRGDGITGLYATKQFTAVRGPSVTLAILDSAGTGFRTGDTARIVATYSSRFFRNDTLTWKVRNAPDSVRILRTIPLPERAGSDTLLYPCAARGEPELELRVKDETGITSVSRLVLHIQDAPP
ncbi:MAG: hypothetical protein JWP91_897 [Fibrobacteres bacterium]|nr:hypothetical protein [Fibrobacterota bacterium]